MERQPAWPGVNGGLAVLLVVATVVAYQPVWRAGFIWDDDDYVTQNMTLRDLDGLRRMWFEVGAVPQYYPLVHTVFWIEYHLWGLRPFGYHAVNVLLHAVAAILLARLLLRMRVPGAWLAAFLFALHPVGVESVAWVTELKNVLSTVCYLAAALLYWRFLELHDTAPSAARCWAWYAAAFVAFVAALLSKTVTCSLPAALLLARWWATGRVRVADVVPLVPFFAVGAGLGLQTAAIERHIIGAQGEKWSLTFAERGLIAGRALWFYVGKLLWPVDLTFIYPRWMISTAVWWQWLFPAAALGTFAGLWLLRAWIGRGPIAAVAFFAGTLAPALGFINVYPMRYSFVADHFQYLASIGLFVLAAALFHTHLPAPRRPALERRLGGLVLLILGVLSWRQATMYVDLETLWRRTLMQNEACSMAHNNLGNVLVAQGRAADGSRHLMRAVELDPANPEALDSLGSALLDLGQIEPAAEYFRRALGVRASPRTRYNLGTALLRLGELDAAIEQLDEAARGQPENPLIYNNLGTAYFQKGDNDAAAEQFRRALALKPDFAEAANNLGSTLVRRGQLAEAADRYELALRAQPSLTDAANNLRQIAWVMATSPDPSARNGARAVELATRLDRSAGGQNALVAATLAAAYADVGRFPDAVRTLRRAMQLGQSDPEFIALLRIQLSLYEREQPYRFQESDIPPQ